MRFETSYHPDKLPESIPNLDDLCEELLICMRPKEPDFELALLLLEKLELYTTHNFTVTSCPMMNAIYLCIDSDNDKVQETATIWIRNSSWLAMAFESYTRLLDTDTDYNSDILMLIIIYIKSINTFPDTEFTKASVINLGTIWPALDYVLLCELSGEYSDQVFYVLDHLARLGVISEARIGKLFTEFLTDINPQGSIILHGLLTSSRENLRNAATYALLNSRDLICLEALEFLKLHKDIPLHVGIVSGLVRPMYPEDLVVVYTPKDFDPVEAFLGNVIRAKEYETRYPGSLKKLYKAYGITQYLRYSDTVLEHLLNGIDQSDKPSVLILEMRHHYGDMYIDTNTHKYTNLVTLFGNVKNIRVLEVESEEQLLTEFQKLITKYGSFETIIMHGHSSELSLSTSNRDGLSLEVTVDGELGENNILGKLLELNTTTDSTRVIFDCCYVGLAIERLGALDYASAIISSDTVDAVEYFCYDEQGGITAEYLGEETKIALEFEAGKTRDGFVSDHEKFKQMEKSFDLIKQEFDFLAQSGIL